MKISIIISLLFSFISEIISQNSSSIFVCDQSLKSTGLKIGDQVILCLHIQERLQRMSFIINVDTYSVLTMVGEFYYARLDTTNLNHSMVAQIGQKSTIFSSVFFNRQIPYYNPLFNLVIKISNGNITDVVWANDCYTCQNTNSCQMNNRTAIFGNSTTVYTDNNCISKTICDTTNSTNAFQCDPNFYITWFGTDVNGKPMSSANLSMQKFRQYSIGSLYSSALGIFNNTLNQVVQTYQGVKNQVTNLINPNKTTLL